LEANNAKKIQILPFNFIGKNANTVDYLLPSGFFVSQTCGALHKSWIGFVTAKENYEWNKLEMYAKRIQKLQRELGIEILIFQIEYRLILDIRL
jgi:hypothetical protein